jgi:adenylate cyclase
MRLLAVMLGLVLSLQLLVFITVTTAANRSAMKASEEAMQVTLASLKTTMESREATLRKFGRLLSQDHAFKALASESDHDTLLSAFRSYRKRLGADWLVALDLDGKVLADSLKPDAMTAPFSHPELFEAANASPEQEVSTILIRDGRAFQMVMVPLRAPMPIAWVGIGFEITDFMAGELEQQSRTKVNLSWRAKGAEPVLFASTLDDDQRGEYLAAHQGSRVREGTHIVRLADTDYATIETPFTETGAGTMVVGLQRSMDEALAGYYALRWQLLGVAAVSTLLAAVAALVIARRVTRPVKRLALGAERISAGHYDTIGDLGVRDEIGALGESFDNMVRGLIERDRVRSMLGKVVSPAIAETLLTQQVDFDGQEQEVSILFSDIRSFTTLCEGHSPSDILRMLNTYLASASDIIDEHGGVVDKYIGDAIMALFGAPVTAPDDPQRAVETAIGMVKALPALNERFAADGWPELKIGIGIHTGIAVAGNVGSETRLNYTVLGDAVNLASRLEGLCKDYGVPIIVSEATMRRCSGIQFRELGIAKVKGKQEEVRIYTPE